MKVATVEMEVVFPDRMSDEEVTDAVDHMMDAGVANMAEEIFKLGIPPIIDEVIAGDCVQMDVSDAKLADAK